MGVEDTGTDHTGVGWERVGGGPAGPKARGSRPPGGPPPYDGLIEEVEDLGGTHGGDVLYKAVEGYLPDRPPRGPPGCFGG